MALDPRIFGAEILEMTRRGRSFGGHPPDDMDRHHGRTVAPGGAP